LPVELRVCYTHTLMAVSEVTERHATIVFLHHDYDVTSIVDSVINLYPNECAAITTDINGMTAIVEHTSQRKKKVAVE